jgi:hypothetical protein
MGLVFRPKHMIHNIVMAGLDPWAFSPRTSSVGIRAFARSAALIVDPWMPGTSPGMTVRCRRCTRLNEPER